MGSKFCKYCLFGDFFGPEHITVCLVTVSITAGRPTHGTTCLIWLYISNYQWHGFYILHICKKKYVFIVNLGVLDLEFFTELQKFCVLRFWFKFLNIVISQ